MTLTFSIVALLAVQAGTLQQQVIPDPTGANGYEEYLQAADIVDTRQFKDFKRWEASLTSKPGTESAPSGLSEKSSALTRKTYEANTFGKALSLVVEGNTKPTSRGTKAVMVEFSPFNDLVKLGIDASYVAYAKGDWKAGTNELLALLVFANNVTRELAMGYVAGSSMTQRTLTALDEHRSQWTVSDCDRIVKAVDELLAAPPSIIAAFKSERSFQLGNVDAAIDPDKKIPREVLDEKLEAQIVIRMKSLTVADRDKVKTIVRNKIGVAFAAYLSRLQKPEGDWLDNKRLAPTDPNAKIPLATLEDLADAFLLDDLLPDNDTVIPAVANRNRLRQMRLNALIQKFRWQNGRFPTQLSEAASKEAGLDPLTGEPFQYERHGASYRVYSKGTAVTGEIDLSARSAHKK